MSVAKGGNEMTDNEIVKVLECCANNNCTYDCPFYHDSCIKCKYSSSEIIRFAFDLINRQKAEIERLKDETEVIKLEEVCGYQKGEIQRLNFEISRRYSQKELNERIKFHNNKAIKEFYKKFNKELAYLEEFGVLVSAKAVRGIAYNIKKEMVGDDNA